MSSSIQDISYLNLALAFIPVFVVTGILFKWSLNYRNSIYAVSRMLAQLMLIGYFLIYIFESDSALIVTLILTMMVFVASWIALRTVHVLRRPLFLKALISL